MTPAIPAHLADCPACARLVKAMDSVTEAILDDIPAPPPNVEERVLQVVREEGKPHARNERRQWPSLGRKIPRSLRGVQAILTVPQGVAGARAPRRARLALVVGSMLALVVSAYVLLSWRQPETYTAAANVNTVEFRPDCKTESLGTEGVGTGGQEVVVAGVWRGKEWRSFRKVLERFSKEHNVKVTFAYEPQNPRNIAKTIKARVDLDCPPDVAFLPQPSMMRELVRHNDLEPLSGIVGDRVARNYATSWEQLASVDKTLYGVWFKVANKSTVWYKPDLFRRAGVKDEPHTWRRLKTVAASLHRAKVTPFSVAGYDGWTLTDWFENVYLRTAGPENYDRLARHQIPWTHPSVKEALRTLAEIFKRGWLARGRDGALYTDYEESVRQVFQERKAAMVYEGGFVPSEIPDRSNAGVARETGVFGFPTIAGRDGVVIGGDVAVLFAKSATNEAAKKLIRFLATPQAAEPWAESGGFISPNAKLNSRVYPDPTTRQLAEAIVNAQTVRFDLSDLVPPAFGAIDGQGMRAIFRDYLRNPRNVDGISRRLEEAAIAAERLEAAGGEGTD